MNTPTKIDLEFKDQAVRFAISSCSTDKKYSFYSLQRKDAEHLVKQLQYLEKYTWAQWLGLRREEGGLTVERDASWRLINEQNKDLLIDSSYFQDKKYYFHFRADKSGTFRVFGYQYKQFFCVTHLDPKGKVHKH